MDHEKAPEPAVNDWMKRNGAWFALAFAVVFIVLPRVSPWESFNYYMGGPQRFSEWTLSKLESLFKDYGYYVVFLGVLLENSMFLGLLVPGSIILVLGGLAAENGSINVWFVMALAVTATIMGDTISYGIGRMGWTKAIERTGAAGAIHKLRGSMESNATWIILAYHWAGYSRAVGPAAAGLFQIPYRKWAPLDYAGGSVWAITFTMLGVVLGLFGVEFGDTKVMLRLLELMIFILIVVAIVTAWYKTSKAIESDPPSGRVAGTTATVTVPVDDE